MDTGNFDAAWWVALITPLIISSFVLSVSRWGSLPAISLTYSISERQHPVISGITITTVTVWNSGGTSIEGSHFASLEPLRLKADQPVHMMRSEVINTSMAASNVVLAEATSFEQRIDFEFLNPGEGFRWRGQHDGMPGQLRLHGTLKAAKSRVVRHTALPMTMKVGSVFLLVGTVPETISMIAGLIVHEGLSSAWFWGYMPVPVMQMVASALITSSLLADFRDRGKRHGRKWEDLELKGVTPATEHD